MDSHLSAGEVRELLERVEGVRVLIVGDVMLDRYVVGTVERTSPEAPVPVVSVRDEWSAVGGAANVAANARVLGAACHVVGVVGADAEGETVRRHLDALGVDAAGLATEEGRPTTVKTRVVARHRQVVRYDREVTSDVEAETGRHLRAAALGLLPEVDVVVTQDYDKGTLVPGLVEALLAACRDRGVPVVCDPKYRRFFGYRGATVFKPNARELQAALEAPVLAGDPAWMEATRARLGCESLLVTLGEAGMALRSGDGTSLRIPSRAREVYDVSGAGDTVAAAVAVAIGSGAPIAEAALFANQAAAIQVGKEGVATVTPEEVFEHAGQLEEELTG